MGTTMDESSLIAQRNRIKAIGSFAAIAGAIFCIDPNSMISDGIGVMTGLCIAVSVSCVIILAATRS